MLHWAVSLNIQTFKNLSIPVQSSIASCEDCLLGGYAGYLIFYTSNGTLEAVTVYANAYGSITVYLYASSCSSAVVVSIINSGLTLTANPSSIDLNNPPATVTNSGQSFDATYGMPRVEYFDGSGFLIGSVFATYVSGDGTSLQANVPDLSAAYSGTYLIRVTNKTYLGYYNHIVGVATSRPLAGIDLTVMAMDTMTIWIALHGILTCGSIVAVRPVAATVTCRLRSASQ